MSGEPTPPDDSSALPTSSESPHESPAVANSTSEPARDPTLPSEAEQSPPIPALDSPPSTVPPPESGGDEASRAAPPDASPGVPNAPPQPASGEVASPTEVENSLPVPAAASSVQSSSSASPPPGPDVAHSPLPSAMQERPSRPPGAQANRKTTLNVGGQSVTAKAASVCPRCRGGGRNLVVCIDGTSNQFSQKNTNVVELYSRLLKSNGEQLTFYNSGIGTYASPSWHSLGYYLQVIANKLDLAFALRFEKIILSAYAWLADNYVEGDRIFLFGFSRGAYQVRALSAMIDRVGLIHKGNDDQIPFAYELYAASPDRTHEAVEDAPSPQGTLKKTLAKVYVLLIPILFFLQWLWNRCTMSEVITAITDANSPMSEIDAQSESEESSQDSDDLKERASMMQTRFRKAFARRVRVHFVGVWDTVSSVGLVRGRALPGTADGMSHVCYFRHALALHERRVKFLPEFVRGGLGPVDEHRDDWVSDEKPSNVLSSAVVPSETDALLASSEIGVIGLKRERPVNARAIPTSPSVQQVAKETASVPPHTKEVWFPGSHSDIGGGASPNVHMRQFGPSLRWMSFEARIAGLKITKEPRHWRKKLPRTNSLSPFWTLIEFLPVKRLTYDSDSGTTHRPHLWGRRPFHPGQLFYDAVSPEAGEILRRAGLRIERDPYLDSEKLLKRLKDCLKTSSLLSEEDRFVIQALRDGAYGQQQLLALNDNDDAKENISQYLIAMLSICKERIDEAHSVDLANDIQLLLFGLEYSFDVMYNSRPLHEVLGISMTEGPRTFPKPLQHHEQPIMSLGFLGDSKRIISASWDNTIIVWDAFTGQPIGQPLAAASNMGYGAVSPDGKFVFGEFYIGGVIKVWDLQTRSMVQFGPWYNSDTDVTSCFAYSRDCKRIASASVTGITLWDATKGQRVAGLTIPSGQWCHALSFSSAGDYLAMCNNTDGNIQMIHLDDDYWIFTPPFIGHDEAVRAVAYSHDDMHLVSGSEDGSVRVWRVDSRELLHVMTGHSSGVLCVAFSPMGKYVVSGSRDRSVRIWNAETGRPVGVPLEGHTDAVRCVAFTPDGTRVVSGSDDNTIRIWDRMPTVVVERNLPYKVPFSINTRRLQSQQPTSDDTAAAGAPLPAGDSVPPAAPNPPSGADPNLPTAAGDAPQPAEASSPPVADQTTQPGAADALPEPGQEPRATVATVPGFEGREGHCDDPAQTAHGEAPGAAAQGEVEAVAEGAEAGDAVAQGTVTVSTVGPSLEDAKGPVPPSEGAASNRAGNDAQLADQSSSPVADQPTQSGAADAPPEPEQDPRATVDKVSGCDDPDTHGDVRPPSPQGDAAHVEGDSEAGDTVAQGTTATVAPSSEDAKGPVAPPDAAAPASPSAAQTTLLAAAGDKPDGQLAEDQQTAPPFADAAHAPEPVQEPHATAGEVPGSEGPGGHGEGRPQTAHIEAAGAGDAGEAEAALDAATASVTATVEHSLEDEKGRLG